MNGKDKNNKDMGKPFGAAVDAERAHEDNRARRAEKLVSLMDDIAQDIAGKGGAEKFRKDAQDELKKVRKDKKRKKADD
jgi:hypothetical protein